MPTAREARDWAAAGGLHGIGDSLHTPFSGVDVLEDPEVREGIKAYGNWPTIPQLYVLDQFLWRRAEAKKRDHRKLGLQLDLFSFHDVSPGCRCPRTGPVR